MIKDPPESQTYPSYRITGITTNGRRFSIHTIHWWYAMGINIWRGNVWGVDWYGKRKLLKRVYN